MQDLLQRICALAAEKQERGRVEASPADDTTARPLVELLGSGYIQVWLLAVSPAPRLLLEIPAAKGC